MIFTATAQTSRASAKLATEKFLSYRTVFINKTLPMRPEIASVDKIERIVCANQLKRKKNNNLKRFFQQLELLYVRKPSFANRYQFLNRILKEIKKCLWIMCRAR